MPMPTKYTVPWSAVDPTMQDGGISGELAGFVGPDLGDNKSTVNKDAIAVFTAASEVTSALSMHAHADAEGPPDKGVVEETLSAINYYAEAVMDRSTTFADALFSFTHAIPPRQFFRVRPVRFPVRSAFINEAVHMFLGTMVEIAESNANAVHSKFSPQQSAGVLAAVWELKANIIRRYFDLEIAGEISARELSRMFADKNIPGPMIVPTGESHPAATKAEIAAAKEGVSLTQWYPTEEEWSIFAKKMGERWEPSRIRQPEGGRQTTEDVAPETPVAPQRAARRR